MFPKQCVFAIITFARVFSLRFIARFVGVLIGSFYEQFKSYY